MGTALITGATAGIGLAFAEALARRGHDLVLVARNEDRLRAVKNQLDSVDVEVIPADLATEAAAVEDRLRSSTKPVDLLVNNAGFTLGEPFLTSDISDEEQLLDVLVRAVLRLTHAAVGPMVERGHGAVINVGSVATWVPRGTYSAAKAWVTTFTEGVAAQLSGTGVRAMALLPGYTRTEFHQRADMDMTRLPSWLWMQPSDVAQAALRDLDQGRVVSVPGAVYRAAAVILPRLPRALLYQLGRQHPADRARRR